VRTVTVFQSSGAVLSFKDVEDTHDEYLAGHSFFFITGKEEDGQPYETAIPVCTINQIDSVGESDAS